MGKIQCTDGFKVLSLVPCQGAIFILEGFLDEVSFKMKDLEKMVRLSEQNLTQEQQGRMPAC